MENMIAELWYGNVDPRNQKGHNEGTIRRATVLAERNYERLSEGLNEEQRERLARYAQSYLELLSEESVDAFVKGFSLGMRLTAQAYTQDCTAGGL